MIDRFGQGSTYLFIWVSKSNGVRAQQPRCSNAKACSRPLNEHYGDVTTVKNQD